MIELWNRRRSPVALSTRRSFTRCPNLDRPGAGHDMAGLGVPVAHDQTLARCDALGFCWHVALFVQGLPNASSAER